MTLGHFLLTSRRPDRMTEVLAEQLGRYRPRDPLRILIEAEAFWYPRSGLQDVEQPDLLAAPPIAMVNRITRAIPVDEALWCVDHGAGSQRLSNTPGSSCRLGKA